MGDEKVVMAGSRIGYLTVIGRATKKNKYNEWVCKCDCGNSLTVNEVVLSEGTIKSCGCTKLRTVPDDAIEDIYKRLQGRVIPKHRRKKKVNPFGYIKGRK